MSRPNRRTTLGSRPLLIWTFIARQIVGKAWMTLLVIAVLYPIRKQARIV